MESIGKYKIIKLLGKGATANVYLCTDTDTGRSVAVKLVNFEHGSTAMQRRLRKLFKVEQAMGPRLDHDHIVKILDAHIDHKKAYLVMEYVNGCSLEDYCDISNLLPMHRAVGIIFKCCLALDHAYHQGIVHRDIKPANIMLTSDEEPKIADFGLSVYLNKDAMTDSTFIMGAGSPAYMSPEQIKGYPVDQKSDLYSLGVVLFQLLTGRLPFRANNAVALTYKIINTEPPRVTDLNPSLPKALDTIVYKALQKDLYNRYKNGADFAKDLASVRYEIVREDQEHNHINNQYFQRLRGLATFTEYSNVELWELIRSSQWRQLDAGSLICAEGAKTATLGVLIAGHAEASLGGRVIYDIENGQPYGASAYLLQNSQLPEAATLITTLPSMVMEMRPAALAIASDELQEKLRQTLTRGIIERWISTYPLLAQQGREAQPAKRSLESLSADQLKLVE